MKRRFFFRSLVGAPVIAAASTPSTPSPAEKGPLAISDNGLCVCGSALYYHGGWAFARPDEDRRHSTYATRTNENCPQFAIPMKPPRISVEPADPDLVRRVRAVEEREERERRWAQEVQQRIDAAVRQCHCPSYRGKCHCVPEKAYGESRWLSHPVNAPQLERIIASVPK